MNLRMLWSLAGLPIFWAAQSFGQVPPPPNDDYTNRIVLSGSDITFSGTLAGATFELDLGEPIPSFASQFPTQSVWWEWTPTETTTAIVEILASSQEAGGLDQVVVWTIDYASGFVRGYSVAGLLISTNWPNCFTFPASPGTNYEIQLSGRDSATVAMRLIATNSSFVMQQPRSQTITAGDSVFFGVLAAGQKPFTYQWQFNGTNLAGESAPMLALDQVRLEQAGQYRVWITNAGGVTCSEAASLTVTATDSAPMLSIVPTNTSEFAFALNGDIGRRYRVQSSTNLVAWSAEASLPSFFYDTSANSRLRSVMVDWSGSDCLGFAVTGGQKFFRATPFHAVNEICNNNLKQIRFAQVLLTYDTASSFAQPVTISQLAPYFKNGQFPTCPTGAVYEVFDAQSDPRCLTGEHPFEEP